MRRSSSNFLNLLLAINTISIYQNERDHTSYVSRLQPRYGCGYEYYAGQFVCDTSATQYRWVVEGIDEKGYLWRRSSENSVFVEARGQFICMRKIFFSEKIVLEQNVSPPPTLPGGSTGTPPNITFCMNNGTFITTPTGQTVCYCNEFFTGSMCESALCMNGGTPGFDNTVCYCAEGYSGLYCQDGRDGFFYKVDNFSELSRAGGSGLLYGTKIILNCNKKQPSDCGTDSGYCYSYQ